MVYKVDRLSRSLLDFARLMDLFDQRAVSFVSVTQQFNTTTSLGRLTLSILLSFAQFEREIIGERTRDKMSAAQRKGKWVGGTPMLGYDVDPRGGRLVVNEGEAKRVREIFGLYVKHRSLATMLVELHRCKWTTKSWATKKGLRRAGSVFDKASVLRMLTNAIYIGKVEHKGTIYPGEQAAIVEPELWEEINTELRAARRGRSKVVRTKQNALLNGLLFCRSCDRPMVPSYTSKGGRRYPTFLRRVAHLLSSSRADFAFPFDNSRRRCLGCLDGGPALPSGIRDCFTTGGTQSALALNRLGCGNMGRVSSPSRRTAPTFRGTFQGLNRGV
jgi:site-specific DNA recombinase